MVRARFVFTLLCVRVCVLAVKMWRVFACAHVSALRMHVQHIHTHRAL